MVRLSSNPLISYPLPMKAQPRPKIKRQPPAQPDPIGHARLVTRSRRRGEPVRGNPRSAVSRMQSDDVLRKRMNRTGNSLHAATGRQRRRMGDRTVGRAGRIGPRSLAVSGYAGHRPLRFFLGAFRLNAQIESGIAAVAQIGKKMFQHVSVRLSPLQIHQPLFRPSTILPSASYIHTGVRSRISSTSLR